MDDEQLRQSLESLRAEMARADIGEEDRAKLDALISDIEHGAANPEDREHHESVMARIREAVGQFEVEHPTATGILNHIMVVLGNMGI